MTWNPDSHIHCRYEDVRYDLNQIMSKFSWVKLVIKGGNVAFVAELCKNDSIPWYYSHRVAVDTIKDLMPGEPLLVQALKGSDIAALNLRAQAMYDKLQQDARTSAKWEIDVKAREGSFRQIDLATIAAAILNCTDNQPELRERLISQ